MESQNASPLVPQCTSLALNAFAIPNASNQSYVGVPPYYMIAFVPGGVPVATLIGSNASNLTWQAEFDVGTQIVLAMRDSVGNAGGVAGTYNVTIAPMNAGWTNVTLPIGFDAYTYIDRATPPGQLFAAVVDATGQWGISTQTLTTTGDTNVACTGLVSQVHQSSQVPLYANGTTWNGTNTRGAGPGHDSGMASHKITIIIVCVVLGALVLLGLSLFFGGRAWRHRNYTQQDTAPRTYDPSFIVDGRPNLGSWGDFHASESTTAATFSVPNNWGMQNRDSFSKLPMPDQTLYGLRHQHSDLTATSRTTPNGSRGPQLSGSSSASFPPNNGAPISPTGDSLPDQDHEPFPPSLFSFSQPPPSLPTEINYPNTGDPTRFHYPPSTMGSSEYTYTRTPPSPAAVINRFSNPYPNDTPQTLSAKQAEARLRTVRSNPIIPPPGGSPVSSRARPQSLVSQQPNQTQGRGEAEPDIIIQHRDGGTVTELPPPYMDRGPGPA
ncbi:hypothetical protein HWV62_39441 [Athelia sp. TMB]|nr:hypothetical protein HWV62_39441 [Athelia sp. TMB]